VLTKLLDEASIGHCRGHALLKHFRKAKEVMRSSNADGLIVEMCGRGGGAIALGLKRGACENGREECRCAWSKKLTGEPSGLLFSKVSDEDSSLCGRLESSDHFFNILENVSQPCIAKCHTL